MVNLVVAHGYVVVMDAARSVHADGAVAIQGRNIVAVGPSEDILAAYPAAEVVDAAGALVLPGLIDAHNHPILGLGNAPTNAFGNWPPPSRNNPFTLGGDIPALLRLLATPFGSDLTEDEAYLCATLTFAGLIASGVTCFNDGGGAHADVVAQAALDSGIRGIVTRQTGDLVPDDSDETLTRYADVDAELATAEEFLTRWNGSGDGRLRAWINVLFSVGCSDELCQGMKSLADRHQVGLSSHVATMPNEANASLRYHGQRPLRRLHELGLFAPNLLTIHMGHPDDLEIERLAHHDVKVVHCPGTSALAAHGCFSTTQFPKMDAAGITIGIGNDTGSNTHFQLAAAASFHKDVTLDVTVFDAPHVLEMATIDGARTCLWEDEIGSLEPGKRADITIVDRSGWHWQPAREPVRTFVERHQSTDIRTVIVDGRIVMHNREMLTLDTERMWHDIGQMIAGWAAR